MIQNSLFELATTKSPLSYPGSKLKLPPFIRKQYSSFLKHKEVCSPFLGGGSLELVLSSSGVRVYGSDIDDLLVNFWNEMLKHPSDVVDLFTELWKHKEDNLQWFDEVREYDSLMKAGVYWLVNQCSFRGLTFADNRGCFLRPPKCRHLGLIEQHRNFNSPNLSVEYLDFREALKKYEQMPAYIDPPYMSPHKFYGAVSNENFDHDGLFDILKDRKQPWLLSYDNYDSVKEMYGSFHINYLPWSSNYKPKDKQRFELLISNFKWEQ